MKETYLVKKPEDFQDLIDDLLVFGKDSSSPNLVIALQGDLGAGKTTFTQQLAKHLEVEETVTSPTFTIMKQYDLSSDQYDRLVHVDAYRIEDQSEVGPLRLKELLLQPRTIICLEWPEQISSIVPLSAVQISIEIGADDVRQVTVTTKSDK